MWMALGGPEVADSCSCVAENMAEDRPTDCHDLSIRKTRFPSTVDRQRLVCQGGDRPPGTKGGGGSSGVGGHVLLMSGNAGPPEGKSGGKTRRETQIRCEAPQEGSLSVYGTSPLKSPSLSDTPPTRSEVASSA
jgi:hypothetical protein